MSLIKLKTWTWTYLTWSKEQINQGHSQNRYLASIDVNFMVANVTQDKNGIIMGVNVNVKNFRF